MKSITIVLPRELKKIEIHTFADLHIGDANCDLKTIKERIDRVKNTSNAYAILNGDIMNNATKTSVSDSYAEKIPPMKQLEMFIQLFEPIKDKILGATQGNHENRTYTKEGIDLTAVATNELGISDRYSKTGCVLYVKVGERKLSNSRFVPIVYSMYITHGSGGGRKEGSKIIRLADMTSITDVDIYIHSHTHLPMTMRNAFYRTDLSNCCTTRVEKLFVNTSAELDYGGYSEALEMKPTSKVCPVIYLSGTDKFFYAQL